jgi:hypothetical protein
MSYDGDRLQCWTIDEFLAAYNQDVNHSSGHSPVKIGDRKADLFIDGPCSHSVKRKGTLASPLGDKVLNKRLEAMLTQHRPQKVVMFPTCCESYDVATQQLIKAAFPGVLWFFPVVHDFGTALFRFGKDSHSEHLLEELCAEGYLSIEE